MDRVGIQPGTGTMMTPEGKAQYVAFLQSQTWLDKDQASDVALPGIRMDLGIPENPANAWLERCVAAWLMGPTPEWQQASDKQQQFLQQAQQAFTQQQAMTPQMPGVPPAQFQPPPMGPLPTPFPVLPNLTEIPVAQAVVKRLSALMFDPRYADTKKYPPAWQKVVTDVYSQARQAQIPPIIPKVDIRGIANDATTLGQEEAAHPTPLQPGQQAASSAPQPAQAPHGVAHMGVPGMPKIPA